MKTLYVDDYTTSLGLVLLKIESNTDCECIITQQNSLVTIKTLSHKIEVFTFGDIKEWLKDTDYYEVEQSKGWLIKTTKISRTKEQLIFSCELDVVDSSITISPNSGEYLDSVWIENQTDVLSIGTEDNEMLKYRASKNDLMPQRLGKEPKQDFLFTKYTDRGFCTDVPELEKGEQIYFHYLIAANPRKKSKDYPDEDDISTWFAVDFPKWTLVERLKLSDWE